MRRLVRIVLSVLLALALVLGATGLFYAPDPAPLRLRRDTANVDGTRISYHQRGAGADVVLIHGGMGSAEDFEPVLERLAQGFRVTAVDRPGFGLSRARGDDATYPGNARIVAGLVRELGLKRPVVVGHSHGGGVALRVAEQEPDLVGALVLLAPAWYPGHPPGLLDRLGALPVLGEGIAAWLGPLIAPRSIETTLRGMLGPDAARVPLDFVAYRQRLWNNPRSLAVHSRQQLSDARGLAEIEQALPSVNLPSVIVACAQDPFEGNGLDSRRLAHQLRGAELWWLEDCGHYVQYAHPEKVADAIARLARRDAP